MSIFDLSNLKALPGKVMQEVGNALSSQPPAEAPPPDQGNQESPGPDQKDLAQAGKNLKDLERRAPEASDVKVGVEAGPPPPSPEETDPKKAEAVEVANAEYQLAQLQRQEALKRVEGANATLKKAEQAHHDVIYADKPLFPDGDKIHNEAVLFRGIRNKANELAVDAYARLAAAEAKVAMAEAALAVAQTSEGLKPADPGPATPKAAVDAAAKAMQSAEVAQAQVEGNAAGCDEAFVKARANSVLSKSSADQAIAIRDLHFQAAKEDPYNLSKAEDALSTAQAADSAAALSSAAANATVKAALAKVESLVNANDPSELELAQGALTRAQADAAQAASVSRTATHGAQVAREHLESLNGEGVAAANQQARAKNENAEKLQQDAHEKIVEANSGVYNPTDVVLADQAAQKARAAAVEALVKADETVRLASSRLDTISARPDYPGKASEMKVALDALVTAQVEARRAHLLEKQTAEAARNANDQRMAVNEVVEGYSLDAARAAEKARVAQAQIEEVAFDKNMKNPGGRLEVIWSMDRKIQEAKSQFQIAFNSRNRMLHISKKSMDALNDHPDDYARLQNTIKTLRTNQDSADLTLVAARTVVESIDLKIRKLSETPLSNPDRQKDLDQAKADLNTAKDQLLEAENMAEGLRIHQSNLQKKLPSA